MKFIDKNTNKVHANLLVDTFLNSRWSPAVHSYSEIHYKDNAFKISLKPQLKAILLQEQNNLCCYCMRILIDDGSTTLEHIIPQSANTQAEFAQYSHVPMINANVILQSSFQAAITLQITPPYPHTIAYENLTASCDGKIIDGIPKDTTSKFCNNHRGNKLIEPLFYINNIATQIEYKPAGLLVPTDPAHIQTIVNVNLNYDTLEKIRQVWCHISVESLVNIVNANTEAARNVILTVNLISLTDITRRNKLIADYKTSTFWNLLLKYKWFYCYYRINHHHIIDAECQ